MNIDHRGLLASLGLSPERIEQRRRFIGGSDANKIMSGDPDKILRLWREKRGEEESEDLSGSIPVMLGSFTEPFNVAWYEKVTGREVWARGDVLHSPAFSYMTVTLDGLTYTEDGTKAIFEAKHVNAFSKIPDVVQRYMPQLHHNMHCAQLDRAILCVLHGTTNQHIIDVRRDDWYMAQLIEAEREFWDSVMSGTNPPVAQQESAIDAIEAIRVVDMSNSNSWAVAANSWINSRPAARLFEQSIKDIKSLLEPDVRVAFGHGIRAVRHKNNAIAISIDDEAS